MRSRLANLLLMGGAIFFVGSVFFSPPLLPERVASHFGGSGEPNGWTTRGSYLWSVTLIGFGIPALVIGVCFGIRYLPPSMLNVPHANFWRSARQYPEACRILLDWSFFLGAANFLWATLFHVLMVRANRLDPPALAPGPVFLLSGAYLLITVLLVLMLVLQFARPPRGIAQSE